MRLFKINEIFRSFQGEGLNTGVRTVFVRLSGCNLDCHFCDTSHQAARMMSIPDILAAIQQADPDPSLVVITGGEPTIQEGISELAEAIRAPVALETNGTNSLGEISGAFKFIAVSPKSIESLLPTVLDVCDEVKLVIGSSDPSMLLEACLAHPGNFPIWLQPESNSEEALGKVIAIMSQLNDYRLRVGHQMHKIRGWQ